MPIDTIDAVVTCMYLLKMYTLQTIPVLNSLFITQAYCWEEMGAYLTNVNDQNEQDFLTHLINMTINAGKCLINTSCAIQ